MPKNAQIQKRKKVANYHSVKSFAGFREVFSSSIWGNAAFSALWLFEGCLCSMICGSSNTPNITVGIEELLDLHIFSNIFHTPVNFFSALFG